METKRLLNKKITQWLLLVAMLVGSSANAWAKYVYAKMAQSWWTADGAAIGAHYWGTGCSGTTWPGVRMSSLTGVDGTWFYNIPCGTSVVFARVNSSGDIADWGAKTGDLTVPGSTGANLYTISNTSACWSSSCTCSGSWTNFALTPTAVTLTVTDGKISGSGTSDDPYIVEAGGSFTLSASSVTFSPNDPDMNKRYAFGTSETSTPTGTSSTSTLTASSTADQTTQYYVSVRGYYGTTYSSSYKSASVYVKTKVSCTHQQHTMFPDLHRFVLVQMRR